MLRGVGFCGITHLAIKARERILKLGSLNVVAGPADIILQPFDRPEIGLQSEKLEQRHRNTLAIHTASPRQLLSPPIRGLFILLVLAGVFHKQADHEIEFAQTEFAAIVGRIGEFLLGALPEIFQRCRQIDRKPRIAAQRQHGRIVRRRCHRSESVQISKLPQATHNRPLHRRAGFFADQPAQRLQARAVVKLGQGAHDLPPQVDLRRAIFHQKLFHQRRITRDIPRQIQEDLCRLLSQPRVLRPAQFQNRGPRRFTHVGNGRCRRLPGDRVIRPQLFDQTGDTRIGRNRARTRRNGTCPRPIDAPKQDHQ